VLEFNKASFESDVWSFGVVMWEIFSQGRVPMASYSNKEAYNAILKGERLDKPEDCPDQAYNWMKACWTTSPKGRPTFAAIVEGMSSVSILNRFAYKLCLFVEIHELYVEAVAIKPNLSKQTTGEVEEFYTISP
jgi:hypothetical protein